MSVDLRTTYLGLKLANPLVVAACPLNEKLDVLKRLEIVLDEVTSENKRLLEEVDAVRAAATSEGGSHTVTRGETLASIAAKYGVTVSALLSANNISDPNLIKVGQKLVIPGQ